MIREIYDFLEFLGIKGYEARAYVSLIRLGEATAQAIASEAGIPQPRSYEVLENLLRKGLIEIKIGKPKKYRAIPPEIGLKHYFRRRVEEVTDSARRNIHRLQELYSSTLKESRPLFWINYNVDLGVRRAMALIDRLRIDGFLCAGREILSKLADPITRRLRSGESIFSLVIVGEESFKGFSGLKSLRNIDVRELSAGAVEVFQKDLTDSIVFSKNYVMHSREWELALLLNEVYYFGYWRMARPVKLVEISPGRKYITHHHWLAMELSERALRDDFSIWARVRGLEVGSRNPVVVEGYVSKVIKRDDERIRTIIIATRSGDVRVGGLRASLEDIEARYIELKVEK